MAQHYNKGEGAGDKKEMMKSQQRRHPFPDFPSERNVVVEEGTEKGVRCFLHLLAPAAEVGEGREG